MGDLLFDSDFKLAATTVESLTILEGRFVDLRSVFLVTHIIHPAPCT